MARCKVPSLSYWLQMYIHGAHELPAPPPTHELRAVIFDLDGTLADTLPVVVKAFEITFEEVGVPVRTQSEIFAEFGPTEDGVIAALFGDLSDSAVPVFYEHYRRLLSDGVVPFDGIRELLAGCQQAGLRLAVVTGKSDRGAAVTLDVLGLADVFETVRGGSDLGIIKAEEINDLVRGWHLSPGHVGYVGDHPLDIAESRKAGVRAISAGWASTADVQAIVSAGPDELFLTVEDLAAWLLPRVPERSMV